MWNQPWFRLFAVSFVAIFVAAPTPGHLGGCSGGGGAPVEAGTLANETPGYMYFDRGLCSSFCARLRECGLLCDAMNQNTGCAPDDPFWYVECVRGNRLRMDYFGVGACTHQCPGSQRSATEWDVEVCSDAVLGMSCPAQLVPIASTAPDSLQQILTQPSACSSVCY